MLKTFIILFLIFTLSTQKPIDNNNQASFNSNDRRPRCGGNPEEYLIKPTTNHTIKPWNKKHLTYIIKNNTILPLHDIQNATEYAIKKWTENIDLTVSESSNSFADIYINFKEIDGKQPELAYAYYPEIGDMYFDTTKPWGFGISISDETYNFNWVMIHEMGHSFGLLHDTVDNTSIMYPFYSEEVTEPNEKDLNRIFRLYGPKNNDNFLDNSLLCADSSFDLMFTTLTGDHVIIKDSMYWTFNENGLQSGPHNIEKIFPNLPETKFDAIVSVNGSSSYLFKNNYFYEYDGERYNKKNLTITPENVNCGFITEQNNTYVFRGTKFYIISPSKSSRKLVMDTGKSEGKRINQTFFNVPSNIEKCLYMDQNIYFIKNNTYHVVDMQSKRLTKSGDLEDDIFKCYD